MFAKIPKPLLYVGAAVALLLVAGAVKNWRWPNQALTSLPSPKPVPVKAQPTRLIEKKTEAQVVERQVVRRVPTSPKVREKIEKKYDVEISTAPPEAPIEPGKVDLLTEVTLPVLPHGGEAIATINAAGETEIKVLPKKRPFFELGGIRETGASYDPLTGALGVYHEQDLLRTGSVVWGVRGFASQGVVAACVGPTCRANFNYGIELRAGVRW